MRISNIKIKNFKNFEDLSIDFDDLNVIIGSCSSGKSNLFEIFQFLKDISQDFKKAVIKHGGPYIQNINSQNESTYLKITFDDKNYGNISFGLGSNELDIPENTSITLGFKEISYEISFKLNDFDYEILEETMEYTFDVYEFTEKFEEFEFYPKLSDNKLIIKNKRGDFDTILMNNELFKIEDLIPYSLVNIAKNNFKQHNLPLITSPLASVPIPWVLLFDNLKFYDFIPKFCKNASELNESNLLSFGENLPIALENIFKEENNRRKFLNLLNDLLPYIENVNVDILPENIHAYSVVERFSNSKLPSLLISDGTSTIIALIVALYFEKSNALFIEEPERNIHPSLFLKIVQMFNEASEFKQIFITTHSPEILRDMDLKNVFYIYRDDDGFSNLSKPSDNKILKSLIEDFGIDEIFVNNFLDIS